MRQPIRLTTLPRPALAILAGAALLLGLLLSAGARAGERSRSARQLAAALERAPAAARNWSNPYGGQNAAAQAGAKLFRQHCAACHGDAAQGQGNAPTLKSTLIEQTPPGVLFWFLTNGNLRQGMPSWSGLPDQQRWQIVSYLKTLR